jgi:hypothetical protein
LRYSDLVLSIVGLFASYIGVNGSHLRTWLRYPDIVLKPRYRIVLTTPRLRRLSGQRLTSGLAPRLTLGLASPRSVFVCVCVCLGLASPSLASCVKGNVVEEKHAQVTCPGLGFRRLVSKATLSRKSVPKSQVTCPSIVCHMARVKSMCRVPLGTR